MEDTDIDYAVTTAKFSRFTHSGQICMSANRILLYEDVYEEFVEKYKQKVSSLKVGDPRDLETIIGPSGAIHTANVENGVEMAKKIHTGMIHINDITIHDELIVAFGGEN